MIKIIDNFFEDSYLIRDYALKINYKSPDKNEGWRGFRSRKLDFNIEIEKYIIEKIQNVVVDIVNQPVDSNIYFHCSPKSTMDEVKNFHEYKYHKDLSDYAGVVYLTPNPPENSGTCVEGPNGIECIKNLYNRFLVYSADLIHGPDHLFGNDLFNTRLTISFFCSLK